MTFGSGAKLPVAFLCVCAIFWPSGHAGVTRSRSPFVPVTSAAFASGSTETPSGSEPDAIDGIVVNRETCKQLFWSCANEACAHWVCPPSWETISAMETTTLKVCVASKKFAGACFNRYVAPDIE